MKPPRLAVLGAEHVVAIAVGALVAALGIWAQNSALVGVNYDDGIYALLARALADGEGYRLTHIPGGLPGIKYPPLYPLTLVPFWWLADSPGVALWGMKLVNGIYLGLAAALFTLLISRLRILPIQLAGVVALLGFASGSMMLVTASVLSEPLYMVLLYTGLWAADARDPRSARRQTLGAGLLAGLATLTRTVGIALIAATLIGLWQRGRRRSAAWAAATAAALVLPWALYTVLNAGQVPTALVPGYGSYVQLYLANLASSPLAALEILATNVGAILQTLGGILVPRTGALTQSLAGAACLALAGLGSVKIARNAPATAFYPWLYLAIISVWSFPPFRFVFILFPLLLALAATGVRGAIGDTVATGDRPASGLRGSMPRLGVIVLASILFVNMGYHQGRAVGRRVWDGAALGKSAASAEVVGWLLANTERGQVIAYEFDPLIALHTGRQAVPNNYEPMHAWYRTRESKPEQLAALLRGMRVNYLAVRRDVPQAARPVEALIERFPGALQLEFITPRGAMIFRTDPSALGGGSDGALMGGSAP